MARGPKAKTNRAGGDPEATAAAMRALRENLKLVEMCSARIDAEGMTYRATNGIIGKHPLLDTRAKAWSLVLRACAVLGITPPDDGDDLSEYEKFIQEKQGDLFSGVN